MGEKGFKGLIVTAILALAASCIMVMDPDKGQSWQPAEFRKSVDFQAGGTIAVEHTLGNIGITGWDKDSVEVIATGREAEPGSGRKIRIYSMEDLEPSIDVRLAAGVLRIRTRSLGGPWATGGLDYDISVPRSVNLNGISLNKGNVTVSDIYGRVDAAISNGNLTVKNFSGAISASLEAGQADVELLDVRDDDVIDITVKEGDITLRLQPETNARVEAESRGGEITSDYDLGQKLPVRSIASRLGNGAARITLKALRGNIRILKTEASSPAGYV
jgi:hypothetical protein